MWFICQYLWYLYLTICKQIKAENLWEPAASGGWRPSSAPRSKWPRMWFCMIIHAHIHIHNDNFVVQFMVPLFLQLLHKRAMAICVFVVMAAWINSAVRWVIKLIDALAALVFYKCFLLGFLFLISNCKRL